MKGAIIRSKGQAVLLAVLAFALGVQAEPVSQLQASRAARTWAKAGRRFGVRIGNAVDTVSERQVTDDAKVYSVRMREGGTVLMSSDTDFEPVLAFTPEAVDLDKIDANSPLWALLHGNLAGRPNATKSRVSLSAAAPSGTAAKTAEAQSSANARWAALLKPELVRVATASAVSAAGADGAVGEPPIQKDETDLDDMRVEPLVKTKWGQSKLDGVDVFNYYTPNHSVCGCVAMAMAQVMRYHRWPVADVPKFTGTCTVEGKTVDLTTLGGPYDWDHMPERTLSSNPVEREAQQMAMGRLAYECGVAANMNYTLTSSGTSTSMLDGPLRSKFGYANARNAALWGDNDETKFQKYIYPSLDAGLPVIMSVVGPEISHAVIGDGYGYDKVDGTMTPYVHLNMGWVGQNDWWYNLPNIDVGANPEGFSGFNSVWNVIYDIMPHDSGHIACGRVLDANGRPVEGATVTAKEVGKDGEITGVTSKYGVYALILPERETYEIKASAANGLLVGELSVKMELADSWGNDIRLALRSDVTGGDICAIERTTDFDGVVRDAGEPLRPGEKVTVRVRLSNRRAESGGLQQWRFDSVADAPVGGDPVGSPNCPRLGLTLGDRKVFADYLGSRQFVVSSNISFTDLYFQYEVRMGDLAMPARLMTLSGWPAADGDNSLGFAVENWNFRNSYWKLANDSSDECVFRFADGMIVPTGTDLSIFIKGVDFDTTYFEPASGGDAGTWRQLHERSIVAEPSAPTIVLGSALDTELTMYVWVADPAIADVLPSDRFDTIDGRSVIKVKVPKGETSAPFRLRGVSEGRTWVRMSSSSRLTYTESGEVVPDWVERPIVVEKSTLPTSVCRIGEVLFDSLAEAFAVAQDGDTVELTSDSEFEFEDTYATVACGKSITFDLCGKSIKGVSTVRNEQKIMICVENGAELTFRDSVGGGVCEYYHNNGDTPAYLAGYYCLYNLGVLNVESGHILAHDNVGDLVFGIENAVSTGHNDVTGNATLNISGGVIEVPQMDRYGQSCFRAFVYEENNTMTPYTNVVNITGGTFKNTYPMSMSVLGKGTSRFRINISGGEFLGHCRFYAWGDDEIRVTGGRFVSENEYGVTAYDYRPTEDRRPYIFIEGGEFDQYEFTGFSSANTRVSGGVFNRVGGAGQDIEKLLGEECLADGAKKLIVDTDTFAVVPDSDPIPAVDFQTAEEVGTVVGALADKAVGDLVKTPEQYAAFQTWAHNIPGKTTDDVASSARAAVSFEMSAIAVPHLFASEPEVRITATSVGDVWTAEVRIFDGEDPVPAIKAIEDHVKVSTALGPEANWTKATCTAEILNGAALLTIQKPGADRGFMMIEARQGTD